MLAPKVVATVPEIRSCASCFRGRPSR